MLMILCAASCETTTNSPLEKKKKSEFGKQDSAYPTVHVRSNSFDSARDEPPAGSLTDAWCRASFSRLSLFPHATHPLSLSPGLPIVPTPILISRFRVLLLLNRLRLTKMINMEKH